MPAAPECREPSANFAGAENAQTSGQKAVKVQRLAIQCPAHACRDDLERNFQDIAASIRRQKNDIIGHFGPPVFSTASRVLASRTRHGLAAHSGCCRNIAATTDPNRLAALRAPRYRRNRLWGGHYSSLSSASDAGIVDLQEVVTKSQVERAGVYLGILHK
jgi:hypothetical protein